MLSHKPKWLYPRRMNITLSWSWRIDATIRVARMCNNVHVACSKTQQCIFFGKYTNWGHSCFSHSSKLLGNRRPLHRLDDRMPMQEKNCHLNPLSTKKRCHSLISTNFRLSGIFFFTNFKISSERTLIDNFTEDHSLSVK